MSNFIAGLITGAAGVGIIFMVLLTAIAFAHRDDPDDDTIDIDIE